jgi:hypothetical protein
MLQINKNYIFKIAKKFVSQSYVTCDGYLRLLFTHVDTSKQRMSEVYYAANGQLLHDDIIRPVISAYTHTFLLDKSGICY